MICDSSDTGDSLANTNPGPQAGDMEFSISELAPRRLFDSTDTIINIADDILDEEVKAGETTAPFSRLGRTLLKICFFMKLK